MMKADEYKETVMKLPENEALKKKEEKKKGKNVAEIVQNPVLDKVVEDDEPIIDPNLVMIEKIVSILSDVSEGKLDIATEFTRKQVIAFARVEIFATVFNIKPILEFCRSVKTKNIAIDRGFRKELVEAIKQIQSPFSGFDDSEKTFPSALNQNR